MPAQGPERPPSSSQIRDADLTEPTLCRTTQRAQNKTPTPSFVPVTSLYSLISSQRHLAARRDVRRNMPTDPPGTPYPVKAEPAVTPAPAVQPKHPKLSSRMRFGAKNATTSRSFVRSYSGISVCMGAPQKCGVIRFVKFAGTLGHWQ